MKLKNYISPWLIKTIIISFIIAIIIIHTSNSASAYTLVSSGASPNAIFKCQPSTISANFTGSGAVTQVWVSLQNTGNLPMRYGIPQYASETYEMVYVAGQALLVYGNNPSLIEGQKTLTFIVKEAGINSTASTGQTFRVYPDKCTGINKQSYLNISRENHVGGNNTNAILNSGNDPLTSVFTYIVTGTPIGSVIISFIIFVIVMVIYMNTRNVIHPLLVLFATLSYFTGTDTIPKEYSFIVYIIMAAALAGILFKIYKKN